MSGRQPGFEGGGLQRYGPMARWYDLLSMEPVYRAGRVAGIERLDLRPGDRVLDVGCGTGLNFALLQERVGPAGTIIGVDASPQMLQRAAARIRRYGWRNVALRTGDAAELAAVVGPGRGFDAALFTYSLSIIADWHAAWNQTLALLRPGAHIAVVDLALPTAWGRLLSPLARFACFTGVDLRRGRGTSWPPGRYGHVSAEPRPHKGPNPPALQRPAQEEPMITTIVTMWTCHWSARRIQRYLDADPSARLTPDEVKRLQAHLATCQKCAAAAEDLRGLRLALASWSHRRMPGPAVVARVRQAAAQLTADDAR